MIVKFLIKWVAILAILLFIYCKLDSHGSKGLSILVGLAILGVLIGFPYFYFT